jgi:MFS family permease
VTERHWAENEIDLVMSIAAVSGLMGQAPAGALIDISHAKRAIIVAAALVVTGALIILPFMSSYGRKRRLARRKLSSGIY